MDNKARSKVKDEAYKWACEYIESQEEIDLTCVFEGMSDEQWGSHLEFITDCFERGVKPTHFIDVLIEHQKNFNNLVSDFMDDEQ